MRIYVNGREIDLAPGMSVKHALLALDLLKEIQAGKKVYDTAGHEVGLDGALSDESRIYVK
ncbi:MAG: hypothetical protein EHM45_03585 [Desulfobacteraceae bacterium]|nr:MAG: hypothetical protein EHM45_03585 [Desulfobacteraceae bacterium]